MASPVLMKPSKAMPMSSGWVIVLPRKEDDLPGHARE
jgi:hypothetical protein